MKKSMVYAVLALVSGGALSAPAANAETWVMWDGHTPSYVTFVETPPHVMKEISKPVVIEDKSFTKAVLIDRDHTIPRWQMRNQDLNYEAVDALKVSPLVRKTGI
ncbi:MAG: hypothetical protein K2W95_19635 [Candidatus Obscuribacterales bacterium]|nr:hypothetical protein [Candidatus Obscuribacterales bacterium]